MAGVLTALAVAQTSEAGGPGSEDPTAQRTSVHCTLRASNTPNTLAYQLAAAAKTKLSCSNPAFQILPYRATSTPQYRQLITTLCADKAAVRNITLLRTPKEFK